MKHWDIAAGSLGALATIKLDEFNTHIAAACGVLTAVLLCFRIRKAWITRNVKKPDDEI